MALDYHLIIPEDSRRWQVVRQVAEERSITLEQAAEQVFDAGLERIVARADAVIPGLTGQPMSDEDAAIMDDVVDLAMSSRSQRWASSQRA